MSEKNIIKIPKIDIEKNCRKFMNKRKPNLRYASYDYCFNYFQSFFNSDKTKLLNSDKYLKQSCINLGFFLASWGMYRGSGWLLKTSFKVFEPLINYLSDLDKEYWKIDIDSYNLNDNINKLLEISNSIKDSFQKKYKPSDTLLTKIMTGIFGSVPALDYYFNIGLFSKQTVSLNIKTLKFIEEFYNYYKNEIDSKKISTIDYNSENFTEFMYTKAKIIDMVGWIEGFNNQKDLEKFFGKKFSILNLREIKPYI